MNQLPNANKGRSCVSFSDWCWRHVDRDSPFSLIVSPSTKPSDFQCHAKSFWRVQSRHTYLYLIPSGKRLQRNFGTRYYIDTISSRLREKLNVSGIGGELTVYNTTVELKAVDCCFALLQLKETPLSFCFPSNGHNTRPQLNVMDDLLLVYGDDDSLPPVHPFLSRSLFFSSSPPPEPAIYLFVTIIHISLFWFFSNFLFF
jgi:hypothetical protein